MKIASTITLEPAYLRPVNALPRYTDLPKPVIMQLESPTGHIEAFWLKSRYHPHSERAMCLISRESLVHFVRNYASFYPEGAEEEISKP